MRSHLHYLLLDGFDPDTGELALRVGVTDERSEADVLRLKLHLGRNNDPLQPLRRELQTHVQMPVPHLWETGLKLIIRAIEDELSQDHGRDPNRYTWVRTQILHPTDERRSTLNHPLDEQSAILWDWAQRWEQDRSPHKAMDILERLLLLAPQHGEALASLCALLRGEGMIPEMLSVANRILQLHPDSTEALLRRGEALLHLEHFQEARDAFAQVLKTNPVHPLAHLGAAQARSYAGSDACPHLDAAAEIDRAITVSVLRETYDYRILAPLSRENTYAVDELPAMLGVSPGEVATFLSERGLPARGEDGSVRESELNLWVTLQNRYQLLPASLHWIAPTPRHIPNLS